MRKPITIWLDDQKAEHADLLRYASELKQVRKFSEAVRDGLRLIRDLRAGSLDVLCELFPWVENALMDAIEAAASDKSGNSGNGEVLARLDQLQRKLDAQQLPGSTYQQAPSMVSGNLGELKPLSPPKSDDDILASLEVKEADRSDVNATQNFINSLMALQSTSSPKPSKPQKPDYRKPRNLDDLIEVRQA